jgi:hypothetical protein
MVIKWSENKGSSWLGSGFAHTQRLPCRKLLRRQDLRSATCTVFLTSSLTWAQLIKEKLRTVHAVICWASICRLPHTVPWAVKAFPSAADSGAAAAGVAASSVALGRAFAPIAASVAGAVAPTAVFLRR